MPFYLLSSPFFWVFPSIPIALCARFSSTRRLQPGGVVENGMHGQDMVTPEVECEAPAKEKGVEAEEDDEAQEEARNRPRLLACIPKRRSQLPYRMRS